MTTQYVETCADCQCLVDCDCASEARCCHDESPGAGPVPVKNHGHDAPPDWCPLIKSPLLIELRVPPVKRP